MDLGVADADWRPECYTCLILSGGFSGVGTVSPERVVQIYKVVVVDSLQNYKLQETDQFNRRPSSNPNNNDFVSRFELSKTHHYNLELTTVDSHEMAKPSSACFRCDLSVARTNRSRREVSNIS